MASAGAAAGQDRRSAAHVLRPIVGVLLFLVLWDVVSGSGLVDSRSVPPPPAVFGALVHVLGERMFLADAVSTVSSWLIAVVLATFAGIIAGLALGSVSWLRTASTMVVDFLRPLPAVALIPLAIAADSHAKITLAVFAAVWPVLFSTLHALGEMDPQYTEVARSYRVAWWRTVLWVTIPAILPCVLTGVRFATSLALVTLIGTEFLIGGGLGQFIRAAGRMDLVLAGTVFAGLLGLLANLLIDAVRRRMEGARHE